LRAVVGRPDTHLKLVDHQQHMRSIPLISSDVPLDIPVRYPL
jgi:hypothetical protein